MDLRIYYQKIRKIEAAIPEESVVIISRETPDGGKAGRRTNVPRSLAARMIAEDRAELATAEEAAMFQVEEETRWKAAQAAADFTETEVRALRSALRPQRKV